MTTACMNTPSTCTRAQRFRSRAPQKGSWTEEEGERFVKLGVMQPYLFPYIGYFDLTCRVDRWVVFDTAQYPRHGWVNRNRILHPVRGWQYIIAPVVKHHRAARICDVQVIEDRAWCKHIEGQLAHYRRRAPYFDVVMSLVRDCLSVRDR